MADFSLRAVIETAQLQKLVQDLKGGPERLARANIKSVQKFLNLAERRAQKSLSGPKLKAPTGHLRAAISNRVEAEVTRGGRITGRLGVLTPGGGDVLDYAAAQEFGAVATPKRSQLLTIPLKAALSAGGASRFTTAEARRTYTRTFWSNKISSSTNLPILYGVISRGNANLVGPVQERGGRGTKAKGKELKDKLVALFLGVKRVDIAGGKGVGVRYLRDALDSIVEPLEQELAANAAKIAQKSP